jgi:hypothetical protein
MIVTFRRPRVEASAPDVTARTPLSALTRLFG